MRTPPSAPVELPALRTTDALAWSEAMVDGGIDAPAVACWVPARPAVAIGLGQSLAREVNVDACRDDRLDLVRRASGGGAVWLGPGVLCWEAFLPRRPPGSPPDIHGDFARLSAPMVHAGISLGVPLMREGISDLTVFDPDGGEQAEGALKLGVIAGVATALLGPIGEFIVEVMAEKEVDAVRNPLRKVAGLAQLRRRGGTLVHGSLLVDADLSRLSRYLSTPSEVPEYRANRPHDQFCTTLARAAGRPLTPADVAAALHAVVTGMPVFAGWRWLTIPAEPSPDARRLIDEKYANPAWTARR